jgi:hypothetical protein
MVANVIPIVLLDANTYLAFFLTVASSGQFEVGNIFGININHIICIVAFSPFKSVFFIPELF